MNSGKLKIAVWNVRGLYSKEKILQEELKRAKVDIAIIPETKKKLKGSQELEDYILLYSGVPSNKRAAAGIAIMVKNSFRKRINSYAFINERILQLRYKFQRGYLTLLAVYAPEEGKIEETNAFYETLQDQIDKINKNDYVIVAGDYNARVGKLPINGILGTNGEITINNNGNKLKEFASLNELKITNTFFRHKEIHKITWSSRGYSSIIDYILTNKKLSPLVNDTRVFRGYDISSDHFLLISQINTPQKWYIPSKRYSHPEEIFRVHLLEDTSIKFLYRRRLEQKLTHSACSLNINEEWTNLKNILLQAANEALGKRKKRKNKRHLIIWNDKIKDLIENKKKAYLKYLSSHSEIDKIEYKRLTAMVKRETRNINRQCWETFISRIEHDLHGPQLNAYKIIKNLNKTEKDNLKFNPIPEQKWLEYYGKLWTKAIIKDEVSEEISPTITEDSVDLITIEELEFTIEELKSRKSPGQDGINNELFKYAPKSFLHKFLNLINVCWICGDIPQEWRTAIVIPIHKKGDRTTPDNYRGISLLNTGYKIYSKIIAKRLTAISETLMLEEQNGFRKGRSCMDCVFSLSQVIEKHREFNIPTYISFIDFKKAFDSVDREKLWTIMEKKGIPNHLILTIKTMYSNNTIRINNGNGISEGNRHITQGVRQGCPLSPVLFNLYLDHIIRVWLKKLRTTQYFKELIFNTLLFADDQLIISDTEDNLQMATYTLSTISRQYNLEISTKKTKIFGFVGTDHIRTKIIIENEILEQVHQFNYLGCNVSYQVSNDLESKLAKFLQLIGTIKRTILRKVRKETILKLYKTLILPTFLYGSENWILTTSQRRRIEAAEMRLLRPLAGYTLLDHRTNESIHRELNISNILETIDEYRSNWHSHLQRMPTNRIPLQTYNYKPRGTRRIGRPKKRWREQL